MKTPRAWTVGLLVASAAWWTAPAAAAEDDAEELPEESDDDASDEDAGDEDAGDEDAGSSGRTSHGGWEDPGEDAWAESKWDSHFLPPWMSVGIGFQGMVGANFIAEPNQQTVQGVAVDPGYPGFAGLTTGYGPSFDVRFLGVVGFELDIFFHTSRGSAELSTTTTTPANTLVSGDHDAEIQHSALHIPLLFKGVIPGRFVQPMLVVGPEFVMVNESTASTALTSGTLPLRFPVGALSRDYVMVTVGFGMEILLPIPEVDIRIPILVRGSFNPGGSSREDLSEATIGPDATEPSGFRLTSESYYTEFQYQVGGQFGLAWHF